MRGEISGRRSWPSTIANKPIAMFMARFGELQVISLMTTSAIDTLANKTKR
jgi:hypothetical protein